MDGFWSEMAKLGKDRNPYRAGFLQFVGVGKSRQHAMELYAEAAEYFYGNCLHIDPRFAAPPGYATEATQRKGLAKPGRQGCILRQQVQHAGARDGCDCGERLRHRRFAR